MPDLPYNEADRARQEADESVLKQELEFVDWKRGLWFVEVYESRDEHGRELLYEEPDPITPLKLALKPLLHAKLS